MKPNIICKWLSVLQIQYNAFRTRETNQKFLDLRKRTEISSICGVVGNDCDGLHTYACEIIYDKYNNMFVNVQISAEYIEPIWEYSYTNHKINRYGQIKHIIIVQSSYLLHILVLRFD